MSRRILHVVTNVDRYAQADQPTGLWLSELTHAHEVFAAQDFEQHLVSPKGGLTPLEPKSLKWPNADASARRWLGNPTSMDLLSNTARPDDVDAKDFDAIYFTGGHAVMFDFPDDVSLQRLTRDIYESGGVVASVCTGTADY